MIKKPIIIPAVLLSKEDASILKLKNLYYAVLIPKSLILNFGIESNVFDLTLISKNGVMSLELACQQTKGQELMNID